MSKGIFVTATGTDVGKTYITAYLIKKMKELGYNTGYYKAALSGIQDLESCDACIVKNIANLDDDITDMVSYRYIEAISPHLASKIENNPVEMYKIKDDFENISSKYDYVVVEGSGGIVCPIRYDDDEKIMLEDIVKTLNLDTIVIANANLGSINYTVLTISYLKNKNINVKGIIINNYVKSIMQDDNIYMIEQITGVKVLTVVGKNEDNIEISRKTLDEIFG